MRRVKRRLVGRPGACTDTAVLSSLSPPHPMRRAAPTRADMGTEARNTRSKAKAKHRSGYMRYSPHKANLAGV